MVRGIFAELKTVVIGVLWHFCSFFRTVVSTFGLLGLWRCHFGRFVVANQCSLCSNLPFSCFFPHFLSFPKRFEHGRFLCKGGRDMAGIITTGLRPNLSFSLVLPPFSSLSPLFPCFTHTFPSSLLFFQIFHSFPVIFLHLLTFSAFSHVFLSKRRVSM